ncbi:MAG: hypothetical protein WBA45_02725 [Microthrixaceae bacterium]
MSDQRNLAELIASEAPVGSRRALAITLAMVDELIDLTRNGQNPSRFSPTQVDLGIDGSVSFDFVDANAGFDDEEWSEVPRSARPSECAASVGHALFELLMARAPVDSSDAFEPGITSKLTPALSSLIVRSISDSPTQWPTLDLWAATLAPQVRGSATPPPPARERRDRRRRVISVALLVLLAAISVLVISQAAGWWNNATRDEGSISVELHLAGIHSERATS